MMKRKVLFVQLPIPPAGPTSIVGNVPLAAAYMIMYARSHGLDEYFDLEILPPPTSNYASESGIVEAILDRDPWMVGFTCYLWSINRTLWIAQQIKFRRPEIQITLGGPEITADNAWVQQSGIIDYAVVGEGEQTMTELLRSMTPGVLPSPDAMIPGLWRASSPSILPLFRKPLANLNEISSPYLARILDAADEQMLMLETIRGCVFKCKFCYYPKSYDALYFVDEDKIIANLRHARERGAKEVVLLDPTLNQRKDFDGFLRLLAKENVDHQFEYFGELRAEGIKPETARLLREANFTEVEVGLQSIDPAAQSLMDRKNNLKAFEKGVQSMMDAGLNVKVDLIIGLPGDTVSSVRRGFEYLASNSFYSTVQVFNLAILPGTAFRQEAAMLGLSFQDQPPYYVLETPTMTTSDFYDLMAEAEEIFESEWDPFPPPKLEFEDSAPHGHPCISFDLAQESIESREPFELPTADRRTQALTLWFRGREFQPHRMRILRTIEQVLIDNPHSTLQIVLEPTAEAMRIAPELVRSMLELCYRNPNYLDRYYSLHPRGLLGSKRVLVLIESHRRNQLDAEWLDEMGETALIVYRGNAIDEDDLADYEVCLSSSPMH